jgi:LAGLIDADG endonuclease
MQQAISEKFIINLSDTLDVSCIFPEYSNFFNFLFLNFNECNSYLLNHSNYTTSNKESCSNSIELGTNYKKAYNLNPFFITGFFYAEGSFIWSLIKQSTINLFKRYYSSMYTFKVKTLLNLNNSQVTKALYSWVGTSETIRLLNINTNPTNKKLTEWLAGLIDGDGCFQLSKKGYASLEITMDIRDEHALQIIKNIYGGSIKLRSGANALRYRLHHKSGLLNLINDINGLIRNSNRLVQLKKICDKYQINFIYPEELNYENGWLSGLFDSDGTVTINKTNTQLSISVSQKTSELLLPLVKLYGGYIYIDNGKNKSFKWYISNREDILNLVEYFKNHPSRSAKKNRLHLIPKFYELTDLKAHKAISGTFLYKSWNYFYKKWLNYENNFPFN